MAQGDDCIIIDVVWENQARAKNLLSIVVPPVWGADAGTKDVAKQARGRPLFECKARPELGAQFASHGGPPEQGTAEDALSLPPDSVVVDGSGRVAAWRWLSPWQVWGGRLCFFLIALTRPTL